MFPYVETLLYEEEKVDHCVFLFGNLNVGYSMRTLTLVDERNTLTLNGISIARP